MKNAEKAQRSLDKDLADKAYKKVMKVITSSPDSNFYDPKIPDQIEYLLDCIAVVDIDISKESARIELQRFMEEK